MDPSAARKLRRLRTLGRRALCVVVWLASDDASEQFLPVKSAGAVPLARRRRSCGAWEHMLEGLCSLYLVACLGSCAVAAGEHDLLLEFASDGSLADAAARSWGRLENAAMRPPGLHGVA